jgi:hypothetical protein
MFLPWTDIDESPCIIVILGNTYSKRLRDNILKHSVGTVRNRAITTILGRRSVIKAT